MTERFVSGNIEVVSGKGEKSAIQAYVEVAEELKNRYPNRAVLATSTERLERRIAPNLRRTSLHNSGRCKSLLRNR
jgi:hypothetical protein